MNNKVNINIPYFSIVICTYNRANLLPRALQSLVEQDFKKFEIVIIDDGSNDNTFEVQRNFRNSLKNKIYIYQKNSGLPSARNLGVKSSQGKYITFLDSDDEYEHSHLKERYKILENDSEIDLLHGGVKIIGNPFVPDIENPNELIPIENCVVGGTFFFKKGLFEKLRGFRRIEYGDDTDFFQRAKESGAKIVKTNIKTYIYYRDTPDSMCNKKMREINK